MHKECIEQIHVVVGKYFEKIFKSTCIMNMHGKILKKKKKEKTPKNKETKKPKMLQLYTLLFIRVLGLHIFILPRLSHYSTDVYT